MFIKNKEKTISFFKLAFILIFMASFFNLAKAEEINDVLSLTKKPKIQAGLYESDDWVEVTANYKYKIKTAAKKTLKEVKKNETTRIKYNKEKNIYIVRQGEDKFTSEDYIKIVPKKPNRLIAITNYENRPSWDETLNDNQFKGKLKIEYAPLTDKTWVVNILGLENYIKGIGEASNNNDQAYLKTLLTAARTYAYWHYLHPTKHADEPYLLDTSANDQIYLGWSFTKRAPNIKQAVDDSRGMIVTYNNEVAVTPYFSQSDGRTRSWGEVWSGDYEYLISVDDPGCANDSLLGHGVGLSAKGARYFAEDLDWGFKKILKYYYTGVDIKKIYN